MEKASWRAGKTAIMYDLVQISNHKIWVKHRKTVWIVWRAPIKMRLQQEDATLVKTYRPSGLDEEPIGIVAFCCHLEAGAACAAFQDDVASETAHR
jgi:hypothetical protein